MTDVPTIRPGSALGRRLLPGLAGGAVAAGLLLEAGETDGYTIHIGMAVAALASSLLGGGVISWLLSPAGPASAPRRETRRQIDASTAGLALLDAKGSLLHANDAFRRLLGLPAKLATGRLDELLAIEHSEGDRIIRRHLPAGQRQIALRRAVLQPAGDDEVLEAVDVTTEREAKRMQAVQARVLETATEAIAIADMRVPDYPIVYVNPAFTEMTGYTLLETIGRNCRHLQGSDRMQPEIARMRQVIADGESVDLTLRNYRKDGTMFWNQLRLVPVADADGVITNYVASMRDVTQQREQARLLQQAAVADPITGLPNRPRFAALLQSMLDDPTHDAVLVAALDIRNFHEMSTTSGHELGEELLAAIGRRLSTSASGQVGDSAATLLGRLSGTEFGLAMPVEDEFAGDSAIVALRRRMSERFMLTGTSFDAHVAIGFLVAERSANASVLMRQASLALHQAREAGPREVRRFEEEMEAALRGRIRLTGEVHQAVEHGDFSVHFQPKVRLRDGRIVGAEALVRWQHPVFGEQLPGRFIATAEQTGLIVDIGELVLRRTARVAAALNRGRRDKLNFAVNVSQVQFMSRDMSAAMNRITLESGIDPSWLVLELTESIFADPSRELVGTLRRLRDAGFGISIDDFGTGYSSLRYLRSFPVSEIKIDRSFIAGVEGNDYNRAIVEAILRVGGALGATVVAEGVETETERAALASLGCEYAQGHLFGPASEEAAFAAMLAADATPETDQVV
jgi:PAS domain S-box-containing protein/diguanylate cyclase (GGDEF)-like protein